MQTFLRPFAKLQERQSLRPLPAHTPSCSRHALPPLRQQKPVALGTQADISNALAQRGLPSRTSLCKPALCRQHAKRKAPQVPQAAAQYGQMEGSPNRRPPGILVRVISAFFFMIPWMDVYLLGREMYHRFPHTLVFYYLGKPLMPYYFLSQWTPLVLFFLMYLYVIRNTKLHHFMRFNCMQAIMLDIITMVFNLLRSYFPAEFRWSILMDVYDMFAFNACMCTIVYCMFYALRGRYADIPYVSESVYLQVEPSI